MLYSYLNLYLLSSLFICLLLFVLRMRAALIIDYSLNVIYIILQRFKYLTLSKLFLAKSENP